MMDRLHAATALLLASSVLPASARAEDLYHHDGWPALAGDRRAEAVGDILTVVVYENAVASNSAQKGTNRNTSLQGSVSAGSSLNESGQLGFGGRYDGAGQTARSGRMVATISVTVEAVMPNGDLRIAGAQTLNVNGERTFIRLKGLVRRADIVDNSVLSSRIADAQIDYDGSGFVSRSTKPGLVTRVFRFLGLM